MNNTKKLVKYPTKEEILNNIPNIKKEISLVVPSLKKWKSVVWSKNKKTIAERLKNIKICSFIIIPIFDPSKEIPRIVYKKNGTNSYIPIMNTITLNKNISLISFFHEIGHVLFGNSELHACSFSIGIFKEVFPKSFEKLVWEEHRLVKK